MLSVFTMHTHTAPPPHKHKRNARTLLEVTDVFISLIVVMVTRVYIYTQTYQIVYINYALFLK